MTWDDETCLRFAEAYDREDAAQRGEPSPHADKLEGYAEWAADRIACVRAGLGVVVRSPDSDTPTPERQLVDDILSELVLARTKFPGKNATFAALVEEVGELATATFEESADRVRKEAIQVAVMAMRMVLDGDHCFDAWRDSKGLDCLDPVSLASTRRIE